MTELVQPGRKIPEWIKVRAHQGENYQQLKQLVRERRLHTVCEEAQCPNIFDCWERRSATFMILGDVCTLACRFSAPPSRRSSRSTEVMTAWRRPSSAPDSATRSGSPMSSSSGRPGGTAQNRQPRV